MNINDYQKALTAEDLIRRYNLNSLSSDRKKTREVADGLLKTETLFNNFVDSVTKDLENIQSQVDGNITTWFLSGIPTLENSPANEWTTEEDKINHLGDLYYDKDTGYAYRFSMDNENYVWFKITDNDITEALAIANSAQDTADSKRRIFVVEPTTPYDVGDVWIKDDKDLYRCRAKRAAGDFNNADWIIATDYSNDDYAKNVEAQLNVFKTTVATDYVTNVTFETSKDNIEGKVSSVTTKVEMIEPQIETLQTDLDNTANSLENVSNKVGTLETDLSDATSSLEEVTNKVETIEPQVGTLQTDLENATTSISEVSDKVDTLEPKVGTLETDLANTSANLSDVTDRVGTAETQIGTMEESIEENKNSIDETSSKVNDMEPKIDTMESDIKNNTTSIANNALEVDKKLENYAPITRVTEVEQAVQTLQTDTQYAINVTKDIKENGVSKIQTEKGFTFNDDGFKIDETNSPTSSQVDTNAIWVTDKTANSELLFAGYDEEQKKSIVRTNNLWVKEYFSIGKSTDGDWRWETINDDTWGEGLGLFYIGGGN